MRACADRGLKVVLASSASGPELEALRKALDADDAIAVATSSSDAGSGKPEPDILQAALDQSDLAAENVVFVGDAVWDGAAAAQGRRHASSALTCGGTSGADLREAGAVEIWRDPAHLLAEFDNSALGALLAR